MMEEPEVKKGKLGLVLLLLVCVSLLAIIVFVVAPYLRDTVKLAREYGSSSDTWVGYIILAACILVFLTSIFLLFRRYLVHRKDNREDKA